jgi:diguanylate cyclase (GGDEF)-like protein
MKILLVEDTRAVAAVMAARLASFGHEVSIAENGQVGVDTFAKLSPDLVLMDIEMPVMNGFDATNRIRALEATQQWAWTPIIFLTASDTPENLVTAIEAGGDDFMAKAVPEVVLQAKMKAMARIATLRQRLSVANRMLGDQASRDGLTGLCNRRYMDLRLDAAWVETMRQSGSFGLLMLDVDNFKKYNDHYGHQAGDDCLRALANAVATVVESNNNEHVTEGVFAARYGGEEFAVIMPNVSAAAQECVATMIVQAVRALLIPHEKNAEWEIVTVSIGGAHLAVTTGKVVELFRTADARLYRAKAEGRNRAVLQD